MDMPNREPQKQRRSNCIACNLRKVMVCANVSVDALADFHTCIDDLRLQAGDTIFRAGTATTGVYCIRAGLVKFVKYSKNGSQRIVRIVRRGGVAGVEALFSGFHDLTAIAVGEVAVCRIPPAHFRRMMDDNPALQRGLLEQSHQTLKETETWLAELAGGSAQASERMARLLLRLRDGRSNRVHRFSLEDIGAMLGIAIETASRIISEFTRVGLLTKGRSRSARRYFNADIAGLVRAAEGLGATKPGRRQHANAASMTDTP